MFVDRYISLSFKVTSRSSISCCQSWHHSAHRLTISITNDRWMFRISSPLSYVYNLWR